MIILQVTLLILTRQIRNKIYFIVFIYIQDVVLQRLSKSLTYLTINEAWRGCQLGNEGHCHWALLVM